MIKIATSLSSNPGMTPRGRRCHPAPAPRLMPIEKGTAVAASADAGRG
jgi:hypothetical protein